MRGLHQDPDATPVLGRQPAVRAMSPSKGLPWYYGTEVEGERFTRQQLATLAGRGVDPLAVPVLIVKRQATRDEYEFGRDTIPPRFEMPCPIIGKAVAGRVRIIAPNGATKLVQADGWGHRPYRLPDCYRLEAAMGGR